MHDVDAEEGSSHETHRVGDKDHDVVEYETIEETVETGAITQDQRKIDDHKGHGEDDTAGHGAVGAIVIVVFWAGIPFKKALDGPICRERSVDETETVRQPGCSLGTGVVAISLGEKQAEEMRGRKNRDEEEDVNDKVFESILSHDGSIIMNDWQTEVMRTQTICQGKVSHRPCIHTHARFDQLHSSSSTTSDSSFTLLFLLLLLLVVHLCRLCIN